jgi:hypothetical protein
MMSTRTQYALRRSFARIMQAQITKAQRDSHIASIMLGEMDSILVNSWSHLGDMGLTVAEMSKIKRLVKKRL